MGKLDWYCKAGHSPEYRRVQKKLKVFLRSKGALNKFRRAVKRARGLGGYSMQDLSWPTLSGAFAWNRTAEGYQYWYDMSIEWDQYMMSVGLLE